MGPTVTRWRRAIGIRAGEERTIALVALLFACLEAGRGFGEIGVDTLVVSRFGAGSLPYLFVGLGTIGLTASLAYGAALGRVERIPLLTGVLAGSAVILIVLRALMSTGLEATFLLAWLTVYSAGAIALTIAWTMAGSVFDARQAKRLFPLCTGAAIAGSFVGTLSSGLVAHAFGTETLVILEAIMLGLVAGLVVAVSRTTTVRVPPRQRDRSIVADLRFGFDAVLRSPLMRLVAVAYVLLSILMFSVTYPFLLAASQTFTTEADLATALGLLSAAVTGTSFVVSVVLANRVYARFGVAGAALLLPIVYLGGFGLWLVAFSMTTAAIFRFTQQVTQRGLSNSAWSAFYNVVPRERRAQVLAFNDGVPGQVGTILSGLLLLAAGSLLARDQVFWLGAITALLCTVVVIGVRRRYRASVLESLRAGLAEQVLEGGPGIAALVRDPTVSETLIGALAAPEPAVRRMAAGLLGQASVDRAGPALIRVVDDEPDPTVRVAALEALGDARRSPARDRRRTACLLDVDERVRSAALRTLGALGLDAATIDTDPWIEALAVDPSPAVRGSLACLYASHGPDPRSTTIITGLLAAPGEADRLSGLEAARRLGGDVAVDQVRALLVDPSPPIRAAAVAALAAQHDSDDVVGDLVNALDDDVDAVRMTAARALSDRERTPAMLLEVLTTGSSRAQEAALVALRGHGPDVRAPVIAWTRARLDRAAELRGARLALAAGTDGTAGAAGTGGSAGTARTGGTAGTAGTAGGHGGARRPTPGGTAGVAGASGPGGSPGTAGANGTNGAGPIPDPALDFLMAVLARRESRTVGLALRALVVLGVPEAGGVIRRCLHSDDAEIRAQAIEALDSIGDRELPGRSCGCWRTSRPGCGIAMPRLRACPMMRTHGSAAWRDGCGPERRRCRTRRGPSATSRRCCSCAVSRCSPASSPRTSSASR